MNALGSWNWDREKMVYGQSGKWTKQDYYGATLTCFSNLNKTQNMKEIKNFTMI